MAMHTRTQDEEDLAPATKKMMADLRKYESSIDVSSHMRMIVDGFRETLELGLAKPKQTVIFVGRLSRLSLGLPRPSASSDSRTRLRFRRTRKSDFDPELRGSGAGRCVTPGFVDFLFVFFGEDGIISFRRAGYARRKPSKGRTSLWAEAQLRLRFQSRSFVGQSLYDPWLQRRGTTGSVRRCLVPWNDLTCARANRFISWAPRYSRAEHVHFSSLAAADDIAHRVIRCPAHALEFSIHVAWACSCRSILAPGPGTSEKSVHDVNFFQVDLLEKSGCAGLAGENF
ncbi:hypothetical protein K438DRAFT_2145820 [Mycena galopus ATCC 62051]|nr:hypothetical protein K438DRAFT_2145820 [Mycena galopus ATCC 62051]